MLGNNIPKSTVYYTQMRINKFENATVGQSALNNFKDVTLQYCLSVEMFVFEHYFGNRKYRVTVQTEIYLENINCLP